MSEKERELHDRLAAYGVTGIDSLIDGMDTDRALRTVDYFDEQPEPKRKNLLAHLLKTGEQGDYRRRQKPQTRSERYWAKVTELEAAHGFTKVQAEMTALTAITMEALGVNPTKHRLEARGKQSQPWLFEEAA